MTTDKKDYTGCTMVSIPMDIEKHRALKIKCAQENLIMKEVLHDMLDKQLPDIVK